jgi:hypothetical protein
MILFLYPRQHHVVPKVDSKAQRINASYYKSFLYFSFLRNHLDAR